MWGGEWLECAERSFIPDTHSFSANQQDHYVWVMTENEGSKKVLLRHNYGTDKAPENNLWFDCEGIQELCAKHNAQIEWHKRDAGKIFLPEKSDVREWYDEWFNAVFFWVKEGRHIIVRMMDIDRLPDNEKSIWLRYNKVPEEIITNFITLLPLYNDEGRHGHFECYDMEKIPEWQLLGAKKDRGSGSYHSRDTHFADAVNCGGALEQCDYVFKSKFKMPLFKESQGRDASLVQRLSRFQALDERSLQKLALDMVKYCIERLDKDNIQAAILKMEGNAIVKNLGSLKLLEKLTELCDKTETEAKAIMCPLFGLYDLRIKGGEAHLAAEEASVEECYSRIGIDRAAPYVEQGAQLLERVAECFEKIAKTLEYSHGNA